jgi:hypothetical protein
MIEGWNKKVLLKDKRGLELSSKRQLGGGDFLIHQRLEASTAHREEKAIKLMPA